MRVPSYTLENKFNKMKIIFCFLFLVIVFTSHAGNNLPNDILNEKPNIILFLVDDMGWMDCGAYGSEYYETPNIDALAQRGILFTDAYSASPLCSPTRASILTGKYPARHGITSASGHLHPQPLDHNYMPEAAAPNRKIIHPESKNYLDLEEYTIAEALKDAGYRTAHLGKWHIGLTRKYWPDQQGFDVTFHCAPDPGPPSYFSPYDVHQEGEPRGKYKYVGNITDGPDGEHIMDRLADEAAKFIEECGNKPFLLHLWSYGVHGPWQAKEEYIKEFAKKTDPRGKQGNPVMASMLKSVDECLGSIVTKLEEEGITDNTIIIFFSDNGGNIHSNIKGNSMFSNEQEKEVPWMRIYREYADHLPPTNNYPLRKGKSWTFEGGIRVPLIVVWPGVVKPGSRSNEVVSAIDFYKTMLGMAGLEPDQNQLIDGVNFLPVLTGRGKLERKALFNFFPHGGPAKPASVTVRAGDWKLIRRFETNDLFPEEHLLFNLQDDIGEMNNLTMKNPDKLKELKQMINHFLKETNALVPKDNPHFKGR
jgi:arylsulfatase A-like enzyme